MKTPVFLLGLCLLPFFVHAQLFTETPQTILQNEVCEPLYSFATDLDQDGLMDVLVASSSDSRVYWYRNIGDQVYERQLLLEGTVERPYTIAIIDLEQDGDPDIIIGGFKGWGVLVNDGNAAFSNFQVLGEDIPSFRGFIVEDVDRDGDDDVVVTDWNEAWLGINEGNGQFTHVNVPNTRNVRSLIVRVANLDNDPGLEIAVHGRTNQTNNFLEIYKFSSEEKLVRLEKSVFLRVNQQFRLSDYDRDGLIDIIFTRFAFSWMKNEGDLNFSAPEDIEALDFQNYRNFTLADFNQDGNLDYFLSPHRVNDGAFQLVLGTDSSSLFTPQESLPELDFLNRILSFQAVDMDGDQDLDLLISDEWANDIYWLEFTGKRFTARYEIIDPLVRKPITIQKVDVDADGDLDLVMRTLEGAPLSWIPNQLENGWGDLEQLDLGIQFRDIKFGDLDRDGDADAIASGVGPNGESVFGFIINEQTEKPLLEE